MGLLSFLNKKQNKISSTENIRSSKRNNSSPAENKLFKIDEKQWFNYYENFVNIKFFLIEKENRPNGEYDVKKLIFLCFNDIKKSKEEHEKILKRINNLIFGIYYKFEKPAELYTDEIIKIFPNSKEHQARLFFLIEQAVNSHIKIL